MPFCNGSNNGTESWDMLPATLPDLSLIAQQPP